MIKRIVRRGRLRGVFWGLSHSQLRLQGSPMHVIPFQALRLGTLFTVWLLGFRPCGENGLQCFEESSDSGVFGCGVRLPTSHGGRGSVVVLLLRARARLGSPRNGFWSKHI